MQYLFPQGVQVDATGVASLVWKDGEGPFDQARTLSLNDRIASVQYLTTAFTVAECEAVISEGLAMPRMEGRVELGADAYRVSHIAWIEPRPSNHWLFHKVGALFTQVNQHYGFDLVGMVDALQFTEYGPEQHFDWHMDIGPEETSLRKLSMTLQLSESGAYEGGELQFVGLGAGSQLRAQGSATFFPSYLGHRVRPVTSGMRRSLVAWGSGTPFR